MKLKLALACALSVLPLEPVHANLIELTARPLARADEVIE
jgi:hypothetical protein